MHAEALSLIQSQGMSCTETTKSRNSVHDLSAVYVHAWLRTWCALCFVCLLSTLVPSACTCVVKMQPSLWIFDIWKFHRIFQTEAKRLTIRIFDIPSHYAWNSSTNATILHKMLQYIYTTHYTLHTNIANHGSKLQDNWKQQRTEMYTSTWDVQTEIPQKERHQDKLKK